MNLLALPISDFQSAISKRDMKFVVRLQQCLAYTTVNPSAVGKIGIKWEAEFVFAVEKGTFSKFINIKRNTLNYDFRTHGFLLIKNHKKKYYNNIFDTNENNVNIIRWSYMQHKDLSFSMKTTAEDAELFEWISPHQTKSIRQSLLNSTSYHSPFRSIIRTTNQDMNSNQHNVHILLSNVETSQELNKIANDNIKEFKSPLNVEINKEIAKFGNNDEFNKNTSRQPVITLESSTPDQFDFIANDVCSPSSQEDQFHAKYNEKENLPSNKDPIDEESAQFFIESPNLIFEDIEAPLNLEADSSFLLFEQPNFSLPYLYNFQDLEELSFQYEF
ncbi:hypothetical protein TRFO_12945 [Tritrichomonas foetus]|uniref:Initiator binding domain-containing protein n=1 Tax=Tritrichomonas foetus TaxID=1144522 RepID=A0A1J4KZW5_9EUKA|nr:hypothetical protein TRFO_12945 [Tritrichomonas foetus]|eukprot:OHT16698.1 hypothetical protein TRFO_12945 [Tritrichomonas foetus]